MAWVGGAQTPGSPTPSAGWYWITGEPFDFAPWGRFFRDYPEPNDFGGGAGVEEGDEDYLALFAHGFAEGIEGNQIFGMFNDEGGTQYIDGYIVEYPVPEPGPATLLVIAGIILLRPLNRCR
ncbi:MAG TPA: hypothetical protein VFB66_08740 [Tepidisphaeraceae bacterium]|nr:hypothetical protein [Tepidisphaeraceae bacterium]